MPVSEAVTLAKMPLGDIHRRHVAARQSGVAQLRALGRALRKTYAADAERTLGNKSDPLDEAIYIILSFQTDVPRLHLTWERLRASFQTWDDVFKAGTVQLARALEPGGLHRQKARAIIRLLRMIRDANGGALSLDFLATLPDEEAERFLLRLPGLSWKGARCVLLYSLGRPVLPIDINAFRILKRAGVIPPRTPYRRKSLHDDLQTLVAPIDRRSFHVNLILHGRAVCLPRDPRCGQCVFARRCPKAGVSRQERTKGGKGASVRLRVGNE